MDNKHKYDANKTEANQKLARNSVMLNISTKRLERKPSARMLQNPKSRLTDFQKFSELEDNQHSLRLDPSQKSINSASFTLDSLSKNFCYLSPKNSKMQSSFGSPKQIFASREEQLSIEQIETKEIIQLDFQLQPPKKLQNSKKIAPSRTSNFSQTSKNIHNHNRTQDHSSSKIQRSEEDTKYLKIQNAELKVENIKLNQRVHDLKQQNQYLYRQIQELNRLMASQKKVNQQLILLNDCLNDKIEDDQRNIEEIKINYKSQQAINKGYQVLKHMYKKIQYEFSISKNKNYSLEQQNQKLIQKVNSLSKMLDQYPMKSKKERSKSKGRELSPVYNKQNCSVSNQPIRISNFDIKTPKGNNKNNRNQNFFQLSPE